LKYGWREDKERLLRFQRQYGNLPDWKTWLQRYSDQVEMGKFLFSITKQEENNLVSIKYWPNPGKMARYRIKPTSILPPSRQFLEYMNDWFYRDLSAESHLSSRGVMVRG
jgi:hypothetical protein